MRISDWSSDVCSSDLQAYATRSADRSCRDVLQHIADAANGVERASGAGLVQLPAQAGYRRFHGIGRHRLIEIVERVLDHFTTADGPRAPRSEEHTSELQSLMRISNAVLCLKNKTIVEQYLQRNSKSELAK